MFWLNSPDARSKQKNQVRACGTGSYGKKGEKSNLKHQEHTERTQSNINYLYVCVLNACVYVHVVRYGRPFQCSI